MFTNKKFYTIGEFAKKVNVVEHTLRYWETVFLQFKSVKTDKGHRRYTDEHIPIVEYIKELMWVKKYQIDGAKKALSEWLSKPKSKQLSLNFSSGDTKKFLNELKQSLNEIIDILEEKE